MTKFATQVDPAEFALIEGVGKLINPTAWEDPTSYKRVGNAWATDGYGNLVVDEAQTEVRRAINESNRQICCDKAMEIIAFIRSE